MPKIKFNKVECIGCGACVSVCDNWVMDDNENKAKPKKTSIDKEELAKNKEAEEVCPVDAIKIIM